MSSSVSRLGVGLIGLGKASAPHALALKDLADRIDVRGVFERDPEKRAAYAAEHDFPAAESVDAMLADDGLGAIILLTPPNARTEYVERFAAAGKAILAEKPLERSTPAAEAIVETAESAGVTLGVVFQHRFRAASEALAGLLAEGALGAIRVVNVQVPWWRDQAYYDEPGRGTYERDGGGVLISQAIHTLDLMLSLTGPVAAVQAMTATSPLHTMEAEDVCAGAIAFESGAVGGLFATVTSYPGDAESLTFDCNRATAILKAGVLTVRWRDGHTETHGEEAGTGGGANFMDFPYEWHRALIADFADAVRDGRAPRITGRDALNVHRLITALETSSREGRRVALSEGGR